MRTILMTLALCAASVEPDDLLTRAWCEAEAATDGEVEACAAAYPDVYTEVCVRECETDECVARCYEAEDP